MSRFSPAELSAQKLVINAGNLLHFGAHSSAVVPTALFRLTGVRFFSREPVSADLKFRASEGTTLTRMCVRI